MSHKWQGVKMAGVEIYICADYLRTCWRLAGAILTAWSRDRQDWGPVIRTHLAWSHRQPGTISLSPTLHSQSLYFPSVLDLLVF